MGTHPSVPSVNSKTGTTLRDQIAKTPTILGSEVQEAFGGELELPFLFKVLSIRKALSIQAHPDKELGAKLHAADPKNYPDPNHKPEMAIAITEFEGFCGFRPLKQMIQLLNCVPELVQLVSTEEAEKFKNQVVVDAAPDSEQGKQNRAALQSLFSKLMHAPQSEIDSAAESLIKSAKSHPESFASELVVDGVKQGPELAALLVRLNEQFPDDIGLFCGGLLLNYVKLQPGEAMFLRAKDPHAYISGDIIECMAASDNVVRAGFTPKFKDVENLVSMLTYSCEPVAEQKMKPASFPKAQVTAGSADIKLFDPPIREFCVLQYQLNKEGATVKTEGLNGPSIVIVTNGTGSIGDINVKAGSVVFIGAGSESIFQSEGELTAYRAFVEVDSSKL